MSKEIASILGVCEMSVSNRVNRYPAEAIEGLKTRPGRGGKAILKAETDLDASAFCKRRSGIGYLTLNKWIDGAIDTNAFFRWLGVK